MDKNPEGFRAEIWEGLSNLPRPKRLLVLLGVAVFVMGCIIPFTPDWADGADYFVCFLAGSMFGVLAILLEKQTPRKNSQD